MAVGDDDVHWEGSGIDLLNSPPTILRTISGVGSYRRTSVAHHSPAQEPNRNTATPRSASRSIIVLSDSPPAVGPMYDDAGDVWGLDATLHFEPGEMADDAYDSAASEMRQMVEKEEEAQDKRMRTMTETIEQLIERGMPDYGDWTTKALQAAVTRFGFRKATARSTLVRQMQESWVALNPMHLTKFAKPTTTSTSSAVPAKVKKAKGKKVVVSAEERAEADAASLQEMLTQFREMVTEESMYMRILRYEVCFSCFLFLLVASLFC